MRSRLNIMSDCLSLADIAAFVVTLHNTKTPWEENQ